MSNPLVSLLAKMIVGFLLAFIFDSTKSEAIFGIYVYVFFISLLTWVLYIAVFPGFFLRFIHKKEQWYWNELGEPPRWFWGRPEESFLVKCLLDKDYENFTNLGIFVKTAPTVRVIYIVASTLLTISVSVMMAIPVVEWIAN